MQLRLGKEIDKIDQEKVDKTRDEINKLCVEISIKIIKENPSE
jgi:hypothetical protein